MEKQVDLTKNYLSTFVPVEVDEEKVTIPEPLSVSDLFGNSIDISSWASRVTPSGDIIVKKNSPFSDSNPEPVPYTKSDYTVSSGTSSNISDEELKKLSFEDLIEQEKLPIKITSGYRPGAITKSGHKSHHSEKDEYGKSKAFDFKPIDGDFNGLLKKLYSNKTFTRWLKLRGYGIIEETTPDVMAATGAKNPLFHLGPDKLALRHSQKWFNQPLLAQQGMKFDAPLSVFEPIYVDTPEFEFLDGTKEKLDWADMIAQDGTPIVKQNLPTMKTEEKPLEVLPANPTTVQGSIEPFSSSTNSSIIMNTLMSRLDLTRDQAAGIMGVIMAESNGNPAAFNKKEKAGTYKGSAANGSGYGAGILQWSMGRKQQALKLIGKTQPIETLSLEDQLEMLIKEFETTYKHSLNGIRQSKTAEEAAATMYCHNVGGFSSSDLPATQAEVDKLNRRYGKVGSSTQVNKAINYARGLLGTK